MIKISPSILASDFSRLGEEISRVENSVEYLHIDVMDGVFVPNITIGPVVVSSIRKNSSLVFDVHLMITEPDRYIEEFSKSGADIITVHYESCKKPDIALKHIRALGKKAGLSIKPHTDPKVILPLLPLCDMILVMTVEPGFGGQSFISSTLDSIRFVKKAVLDGDYDIDIEVDGGINPETAALVTEAGANVIVAGSSVFRAADAAQAVAAIRASEKEYRQ